MPIDQPKIPSDDSSEYEVLLRQMALVDRVIGLEAENARLESAVRGATGARQEIYRLETALAALYASRTWRAGRAVLSPMRFMRRFKGRS